LRGFGTSAATVALAFGLLSASAQAAADFGAPPPGEIPILFNDVHVYARPDRLRQSRLLVALLRDNAIFVPLRSLFEQMGGTVYYDPATRSVVVRKPGTDIRVSVGKYEVTINGESRPLDVPAEVYDGVLFVPLRVISEGMGAYVQWVPDRRVVVIRYMPGSAQPPPDASPQYAPNPPQYAPPVPRTAPPPLFPPPLPQMPPQLPAQPVPPPPPQRLPPAQPAIQNVYEKFLAGDYLFSTRVYNELSPGNKATQSFAARAGLEFPFFGTTFMLEGDWRRYQYAHDALMATPIACPQPGDPGCVTVVGAGSQVYVLPFAAIDQDIDGRLGFKVFDPRIYIGASYLLRTTNYESQGSPGQQHGVGFGVEKLPDLDHQLSIYGSAFYYPELQTAPQTVPGVGQARIQYRYLKYSAGATLALGHTPFFIEAGYVGDRGSNKQYAPSGFTHNGISAGLGIHL
jgi:hypothetical protein